MADIHDVNTIREFKRTLLPAGTVLNGVSLSSAENFYTYIEYDESVSIKKLESELTTDDWNTLLEGAKLICLGDMSDEFYKFRENGFEYPTSSGDYFGLTVNDVANINGMVIRKTALTYPFIYEGIGEASVTFASSTDLDTFDAAALTAHETERQTRLIPAENAIKAVTGSPVDNSTIDSVFAINY